MVSNDINIFGVYNYEKSFHQSFKLQIEILLRNYIDIIEKNEKKIKNDGAKIKNKSNF